MAEVSTARGIRRDSLVSGVVTTGASRGVAAVVPLLVVPIALRELGAEGYGAWAAAVTATSLVAFADLGVGTGLMTRLSAVVEGGAVVDEVAGRRYVSSGYVMVGGVAVALLCLLGLTVGAGDLSVLLGVRSEEAPGVESIMAITLGAFVLNMVPSLVIRVQYAVGRQAVANLWQMAGSLVTLASVWTVGEFSSRGPTAFVVSVAFAPVLVALANTLVFFLSSPVGRMLAPRFSLVGRRTASGLLRLGLRYVVVSVLMTATVVVDPFIVARTSSLEDVPEYAVAFRVFALIGTVGVMLALPLWPRHARAVRAGDVQWIRRITVRMTIFSGAVVTLGSVAAVLSGPTVLRMWLNGAVAYDLVLWTGLATWWIVQAVMGPIFMVQNGAEVLAPQMVGYGLLLVAALPAKWLVSSGVSFIWIPWIGAGLYCLFVWPAAVVGYRRALAIAANRAKGVST